MNQMSYRYRLQNQLALYIEYLPNCKNQNETFKLLDEIQFIKLKIILISRMSGNDIRSNVATFSGTYPSKLNKPEF